VELDDGVGRFASIAALPGEGPGKAYRVTLREGRNREVRRLWEAVGCEVARLRRIAYAGIVLPDDLPAGAARVLPATVLDRLRRSGRAKG
jgi:23S rRNA pseudouridine2605 synthase